MNDLSIINNIQLLVHPTFRSLYMDPYMEIHTLEEELRLMWWEQAQLVRNNPNAIFIEFTSLTIPWIDYIKHRHGKEKLYELTTKLQKEELRTWQFIEMLGSKYILFDGKIRADAINWKKEFNDRNLLLNDKVQINAYGEYFEGCVEEWGEAFEDQLRCFGVNITLNFIKELSLHSDMDTEIDVQRRLHADFIHEFTKSRF